MMHKMNQSYVDNNRIYISQETLNTVYPNILFLPGLEYEIEGFNVKFLIYNCTFHAPYSSDSDPSYAETSHLSYFFIECHNAVAAIELAQIIDTKMDEKRKQKVVDHHLDVVITSQMQEVLQRIETFYKSRDLYQKYGIKFKRGVLIYGAPGTGKTTFIKEVLVKCPNCHFIDNIHDMNDVKTMAKEKITIIFLDEIESDLEDGRYGRASFLKKLENIPENCLVLATTNKPELLDKAFYNRPGRFEELVFFDYPNYQTRKMYLEKKNCVELIDHTEGLSFAHLNEFIYRVKINNEDPAKAHRDIKEIDKMESIEIKNHNKGKVGFSHYNED